MASDPERRERGSTFISNPLPSPRQGHPTQRGCRRIRSKDRTPMNEKAEALLQDVAKLLAKHGPDAFETLARELESGRLADNLSTVLEEVAKDPTQRSAKGNPPQSSRPRCSTIPEIIKGVAARDAERGRLLIEFRDALSAGSCLPTLSDIRYFVEDHGLPPMRAKSRATAVNHLLRNVSELPSEKLDSLIGDAYQVSEPVDRSLDSWSTLILEGPVHRHAQARRGGSAPMRHQASHDDGEGDS